MKYAKLVAMGCAVMLGTVGLTGCTKTTADSTQTSEAEESESVTAQVTAVDGETYSSTGSTDNVIANGYHLYVDGEQVL